MRDILRWTSVATLLCMALPPTAIPAATYTWDADTGATGAQDGSGTWDTTNTNWWDGSAGQNVSWDSATLDWAQFGAGGTGSYTITLATGIAANRVTFTAGPNYTLAGEAITLSRKDSTDSRLDIQTETTFNCPMIVEGNAWNKVGSGTLILNAASPDNKKYVNHNAGIIRLRNATAAGSEYLHASSEACVEVENNITVANSLYIGNTTTGSTAVNLRSNSGSNTWTGTVYIHDTHEYAIIDVNSGSTLTISGRVRPRNLAVGSVTKVGAGTLVLSGNNDYRGPTYLNAGITTIRHSNALGTIDAGTAVAAGSVLQLENNVAVGAEALALAGTGVGGAGALRSTSGTNSWAGTVTLSGTVAVGVDAGTLTFGGIVSGGALNKVGAGTLVLSAANSYTGQTTIEAGTVRLEGGDNRINPAGRFYVEAAGVLDLNGQNQTFQLWSRLRSGGAIYLGGGTLTLHTADLWGSTSISGEGQFVKEGTGDVTFGTVATYTGGTIINNGRIAMYSDSNRLPVTGHVEVKSAGVLDLNLYDTGSTQTIGTLSGDGTVWISGATFILGNGNGSSEFSGRILDRGPGQTAFRIGQMRKTGTGTITLSGQSTYTGATTVAQGTLAVNGSIAASSGILVDAGATLQGHGYVPVISGAGLIAPGNSAGILTAPSINPANPEAGLDFAFEFGALGSPNYANAAESVNDVLRLTDATPFAAGLGSDNTIDVYLGVPDLTWGMTFRGGFYTDAAEDFLGDIEGASFEYYVLGDGNGTYEYNGQSYYSLTESWPTWDIELATVPNEASFAGGTANGYVMQLTAVPEPGSLALLALALAVALLVRRR